MVLKENDENKVRAIWRSADAYCFDVDSTVCMDEAIDELAKFAGKEKEVSDLTHQAMGGSMSFNVALAKRLDIINPSVSMIKNYLNSHPPRLTPGICELVSTLHRKNKAVYLVSGGFYSLIEPIAKILRIPTSNIYANRILFDSNGNFAGYDENQPTSRQTGKPEVIEFLKKKFGYEQIVMVGDGITDALACPPADAFVGFGGNKIREKVKQMSKWFVMSFDELIDELEI